MIVGETEFVRFDTLSEAALAELSDPDMFAEPDTLERAARRLQLHTMLDDVPYVQSEPNWAAAEALFEGREGSVARAPIGPTEGRAIINVNGDGDARTFANPPVSFPSLAVAMYESSGSGALVTSNAQAATKIYTAGHVVYRNLHPNGTSALREKWGRRICSGIA